MVQTLTSALILIVCIIRNGNPTLKVNELISGVDFKPKSALHLT
jgi:hypothetical protein